MRSALGGKADIPCDGFSLFRWAIFSQGRDAFAMLMRILARLVVWDFVIVQPIEPSFDLVERPRFPLFN